MVCNTNMSVDAYTYYDVHRRFHSKKTRTDPNGIFQKIDNMCESYKFFINKRTSYVYLWTYYFRSIIFKLQKLYAK